MWTWVAWSNGLITKGFSPNALTLVLLMDLNERVKNTLGVSTLQMFRNSAAYDPLISLDIKCFVGGIF